MNQEKVLLVLLTNDAAIINGYCKLHQGKNMVLYSPTYHYDFSTGIDQLPVRFPMDYLDIKDVDQAHLDSIRQMDNLSNLKLSTGKYIHDLKIGNSGIPKLWAWNYLFVPHFFLQFRFIKALKMAIQTEVPTHFSIVGQHPSFPWKSSLARETIQKHFPRVQELEILPPPAPLEISFDNSKYEYSGFARISEHQQQARLLLQNSTVKITPSISIKTGKGLSLKLNLKCFDPDFEIKILLDDGRHKCEASFSKKEISLAAKQGIHFEIQAILNNGVLLTSLNSLATQQTTVPADNNSKDISVQIATNKRPISISVTHLSLSELTENSAPFPIAKSNTPKPVLSARDSTPSVMEPPSQFLGKLKRQYDRAAMIMNYVFRHVVKYLLSTLFFNLSGKKLSTHKLKKFNGHALIIMIPNVAFWSYNEALGREVLCDEYVEGLPEALIEKCKKMGWCLSIIYMGSFPKFTTDRPSFESLYPDFIKEYQIGDFHLRSYFRLKKMFKKFPIESLQNEAMELANDVELRRFLNYDGVDLTFDYFGILTNSTYKLENNYLTNSVIWTRIMKKLKPNIVWGGRLEAWNYITKAAHDTKAFVGSLKLGIAEELLPSLIKKHPDGTQDTDCLPDLCVVWGSAQKSFIEKHVPEYPNHIAGVGRSRLDTFFRKRSLSQESARKSLGLSPQDKVVLFGATMRTIYGRIIDKADGAPFVSPITYRTCLEQLRLACDADPNMKVLIKPWRGDNIPYIKALLQHFDFDRFIFSSNTDTGLHNIEYIAASDLVVSNVSSLFGEAVSFNRPVINIAAPDVSYLYGSARRDLYGKLSIQLDCAEKLSQMVIKVLTDSDFREQTVASAKKNIGSIFGEIDGNIARKIIDLGFEKASLKIPKKNISPVRGYNGESSYGSN